VNPLTQEHVDAIRARIRALPADASADQIEQAAHRLHNASYEPVLIHEPPDFLHITKERLLAYIEQLAHKQAEEQVAEQDLNLLVHQFSLLQRLRRDDPDAWDEIAELWQED
jgi:hypothetical protein